MILEQQDKWLARIAEIFLRYGIKSITMDDISRELGISKKTLYQFVSNKDELVLKVVESHINQEVCKGESWRTEAADALDEMMLVMQNVMKEMQIVKTNIVHDMQKYHRDAWNVLQSYQRGHLTEQVRNNLERGISEGLYRKDFDLEAITRMHVAQAFLLFDEDWFPHSEFSRDALFREYILHYLHGILSEEGRNRLKAKLS
jgi:TetR/AcrR family transcriptional regulator, cholesterol catabolism regulator